MLTTQVTFSSRKQMQYYSNLIFNFRAKPSAAKSRLIAIFQSEFFLWFAIVRWSAVGDWFDIELHRIFRSKPLSGIWLNCLVFISIRGVGARLQQPRLNTLWQMLHLVMRMFLSRPEVISSWTRGCREPSSPCSSKVTWLLLLILG